MRQRYLTVRVLQKIAVGAVQDAGRSAGESCGMRAKLSAAAAGFYSDQTNARVAKKRMEDSDGVTAAADAGENRIRQPVLALQNLAAGFISDDAVKIADHHRIGMRAQSGTE